MSTVKIGFKKLREGIIMPSMAYNSKQAGIDFYLPESIQILPNSQVIVPLGIAWEPEIIPIALVSLFKVYMQLKSKSGLAYNKFLEVTNAGVIDEDYRGEIKVLIRNNSGWEQKLEKGKAVCQGIVHLLPNLYITEVTEISETDRNEKGFGSSDK